MEQNNDAKVKDENEEKLSKGKKQKHSKIITAVTIIVSIVVLFLLEWLIIIEILDVFFDNNIITYAIPIFFLMLYEIMFLFFILQFITKNKKDKLIAIIAIAITSFVNIIPILKNLKNDDLFNFIGLTAVCLFPILCVLDVFIFRRKWQSIKIIKNTLIICIIITIIAIFPIVITVYNIVATPVIAKPIIYLYPEEETEVTVTLGNSNLITCSYPEYINSWNILAYPSGDLLDLTTNRTLYSLYYESTSTIEFNIEDEGFVVAREDTAKFLEEKLAILGLSEREEEEFIIYWLPKLQENEYNYIRFATSEEIETNMPLDINPEPDTIIRVLMTYKGLNEPIDVVEQELETPERTGFVAVEWGGTEIK